MAKNKKSKKTKQPRKEIINLPGGRKAKFITEKDPDGVTQTHPVVITHLQRMEKRGMITKGMLSAAGQFHAHFTIANFNHTSSMPLIRTGGSSGGYTPTERQCDAKKKIKEALDALGGRASPSGSCVWHVVGLEETVQQWATQQVWNGRSFNHHQATGLLIGALSILSSFYGYER